MVNSFFVTFFARAAITAGGIFALMAVGHFYGPEAVGSFAIIQALSLGASLMCRLGMDGALMRFAGARGTGELDQFELLAAFVLPVVAGFGVAVLATIYDREISELINRPDLSEAIGVAAWSLPAFTFSLTMSGLLKGLGRPLLASLQENGAVLVITSAILIWMASATEIEYRLVISIALTIACWIVAAVGAIQLVALIIRSRIAQDTLSSSRRAFCKSASTFFVIGLNRVFGQTGLMLLCGALMNPEEFGLFATAERAAIVVGFSLIVINVVYPREIAGIHASRGLGEAVLAGGAASALAIAVAVPFLLATLLFPSNVLSLFGAGFEHAALALQIMSLAYFVSTALGASLMVLSLTGHESTVRNVGIVSNIAGFLLVLLLVPTYSLTGASLAIAAALTVNIVGCWWRLGRMSGSWLHPQLSTLRSVVKL